MMSLWHQGFVKKNGVCPVMVGIGKWNRNTGTHLMITSLVMPQMMSEAKGKGKNKFGEGDSYLDMDEASVSMSWLPSSPTQAAPISVELSYPSPPISPPLSEPSSSISAATSKHPTLTHVCLHNLFGISLYKPSSFFLWFEGCYYHHATIHTLLSASSP